MRSLFLFTLYALFSVGLLAQDSFFTGKIIYDYTFLNPKTGLDITESMSKQMGAQQHYFINEHSYKSYDEKGEFGQLYNSETNTYYFTQGTQIMQLDASKSFDEVIEITHLDGSENILGHECKMLIVKSKNSETKYWYSPQIKIDVEVFGDHKFGEWADYLEASKGALPLKYIVKNENYTWISAASTIEPMFLTDDDFDIQNEIKSSN
jgi:hypothetical protein